MNQWEVLGMLVCLLRDDDLKESIIAEALSTDPWAVLCLNQGRMEMWAWASNRII